MKKLLTFCMSCLNSETEESQNLSHNKSTSISELVNHKIGDPEFNKSNDQKPDVKTVPQEIVEQPTQIANQNSPQSTIRKESAIKKSENKKKHKNKSKIKKKKNHVDSKKDIADNPPQWKLNRSMTNPVSVIENESKMPGRRQNRVATEVFKDYVFPRINIKKK
ncbi:unnamed protein product [Blepharisma stoltei]|uniref:Uncharacterized protein n=1 Tax=Blepharisma stoltei TaxID=1481888 RepID=A0AAU9IWQ1_9CILI|nr:unnamed protein product [Blepharisma stoltei]